MLLVFCALALPVFSRLAGFTIRALYPQLILYNEGWNAYYAHSAANGIPLYGTPPERLAVNYPPLSFHVAGALGRWMGDVNLAGRAISLVSLVWAALCAGYIVRKIGNSGWAAAFASLFCVGWICFFAPMYVAVNDPQMLGHALVMTGAALYAGGRKSAALLALACVLCCVAGFVKHSLLAFPIALSLDLLWGTRRRIAIWALTALGSCAALTGLALWMDGPYLATHLFSPRVFAWSRAVYVLGVFARLFFPALLLCGLRWAQRIRRPESRFVILAFPISLLAGGFFAGGHGVMVNVFFDSVIAMAIIGGLALAGLMQSPALGTGKWLAMTLMELALLWSGPAILCWYLSMPPSRAELAAQERIFRDDAAYLKSKPGPAICIDLLLCYDAGKPLSYDPFLTEEKILTGRLDWHGIAAELSDARYPVIETQGSGQFFVPELDAALRARYRVEPRNSPRVFYVPKE